MLRFRMSIPHALINLCFPPACLLCHARLASSRVVCEPCAASMPRSGRPLCAQCGVTLPGAFDALVQCAECRRHPPTFEAARAPWQYAGRTQDAIRQFKYHRRWRVGGWLAAEMARLAHSSFPTDDIALVVPVPLHWVKRRLKGFNPPESLAASIAQRLKIPQTSRALRRTRWTATQTRLSVAARFRNVRRAFRDKAPMVHDRSVLLIDDVLTSGATAHACAIALKEAGARQVFVLTAARTSRSS